MLKRGKHVCRRVCAKSVRLILGRYSEYLTSRGHVKATQDKFDEMCEARKKHPIDRTRVPQDLAGGFHRLSEFLSRYKGRGWVRPNRKMIYWLQTDESWDERARGVKN